RIEVHPTYANALLIRSSGSCGMFGHPRVSSRCRRSRSHAERQPQRPVPYTRGSNFIRHAERTLGYFVPRRTDRQGQLDRAREVRMAAALAVGACLCLSEQLTDYGTTTEWGSLP